jgi:hypothetical protein
MLGPPWPRRLAQLRLYRRPLQRVPRALSRACTSVSARATPHCAGAHRVPILGRPVLLLAKPVYGAPNAVAEQRPWRHLSAGCPGDSFGSICPPARCEFGLWRSRPMRLQGTAPPPSRRFDAAADFRVAKCPATCRCTDRPLPAFRREAPVSGVPLGRLKISTFPRLARFAAGEVCTPKPFADASARYPRPATTTSSLHCGSTAQLIDRRAAHRRFRLCQHLPFVSPPRERASTSAVKEWRATPRASVAFVAHCRSRSAGGDTARAPGRARSAAAGHRISPMGTTRSPWESQPSRPLP